MSDTGLRTILVVDDDATVRSLTAMLLRRHGYSTIEADDGCDGLLTFNLHQNEVDMVLSDVVMPQMTGTEMIRQILAIDPSVRVLFMTGYPDEARLPDRGHQSILVIEKPFSPETLVRSVRECLGERAKGAG